MPTLPFDRPMLTDGGLETTLIYDYGVDLPEFAAFPLLADGTGRKMLTQYYRRFLDLAAEHGTGFVLETPTWRAHRDCAERLGIDGQALASANREAVELMKALQAEYAERISETVISGCLGPRGDGYFVENAMSAEEAASYHAEQIGTFKAAGVDLITCFTINYAAEGLGIAQAAAAAGLPCVVGFTVETDGNLPSGESLEQAIELIDAAASLKPLHYMINCAHPKHFAHVLDGAAWTDRVRAIRSNASTCSHAELDVMEELDRGNPEDLGQRTRALADALPALRVAGGCCGTDFAHVAAMADALELRTPH